MTVRGLLMWFCAQCQRDTTQSNGGNLCGRKPDSRVQSHAGDRDPEVVQWSCGRPSVTNLAQNSSWGKQYAHSPDLALTAIGACRPKRLQYESGCTSCRCPRQPTKSQS